MSASRHSGVPFLDIGTAKSGPRVWCFAHFDLQMCFAPQRRAIFGTSKLPKWLRQCGVLCILTCKCASRHSGVAFLEHRNFQNGSANVVFCAFWLANVLRATAACHFGTSELPKWLRNVVFCAFWLANVLRATAAWHFEHRNFGSEQCGVLCNFKTAVASDQNFKNGSENVRFLCILTCKCASRHSGVPFFTCLLNSYLRTRRFSEATFRTSGTTNHWKNTAIRDVPNMFRACTFFLVTLHACWSSFCWLDISTLLDTSTLLFNSAYCRKLDF